jgi:hypothetical protein
MRYLIVSILQFWMQVILFNGSRAYILTHVGRHSQDASSDRDEEFVVNVNGLLEDPEHTMAWSTSSQPEASTSMQASS